MYPNQIAKATTNVNLKCLDAVKIYGNKPKKLFNKINKKIEIKKCLKPGVINFTIGKENSFSKILNKEIKK